MNQLNEHPLHQVTVSNREQVAVEGVIHVDSFDDREVILETELGMMAIRGEDLHIKQLNLEDGHLSIEGVVKTVDYLEDGLVVGGKSRNKGWLQRILR